MKPPATTFVLCLLLQACAGSFATHPPVPPALAELVPAPPQSDVSLIWQPGHYDWNGTDYVMVATGTSPARGVGARPATCCALT